MYLGVAENLAYDLMTLLTASKKSFSVATFLLALIANMPASVQTERISAPVELGHNLKTINYKIGKNTIPSCHMFTWLIIQIEYPFPHS